MTSILQNQEESYRFSATWIINPFASVLRQNDNYSIKSPVIESRNAKWQITLDFTRPPVPSQHTFQLTGHDASFHMSFPPNYNYLDPQMYIPQRRGNKFWLKTTFENLKEMSETSFKGRYIYSVYVIKDLEDRFFFHSGPALSSKIVVQPTHPWLYFEVLELSIQIKFIPEFSAAFSPDHFIIGGELDALREVEDLQDFTILVNGQELKANRTILALSSPVFMAMFVNDCKEKREQKLCIEDIDVHTVRKFLDFIYTGQNPSFADVRSAVQLFHAAEKYQVLALRKMCLEYIRASINNEYGLTEMLLSLQPSY